MEQYSIGMIYVFVGPHITYTTIQRIRIIDDESYFNVDISLVKRYSLVLFAGKMKICCSNWKKKK